jgi:transcriptional regulator with XRE-family HTH domain
LGVRWRRDVTQADVAAALETTAATVSRWEAGLNVPKEDALAKLAHYLGVTPAYLRYGIEAPRGDAGDAIINPALDRKLTTEEIARARKQVAADRASKSAGARKKGNGRRA